MAENLLPIPKELLDSGDSAVGLSAPVVTRVQSLPYGQITWQHFEGLCARLLQKDSELIGVRPYGEQGDEQDGIDIFAFRSKKGKFTVCQCKNVANFYPADITDAVKKFMEGEWLAKSDRLFLALRDDVNTKARSDAVAAATAELAGHEVDFEVWDGVGLNLRLKPHDDLVGDYFGPAWAEAFCGTIPAEALSKYPSPESGRSEEERRRVMRLVEGLTQ